MKVLNTLHRYGVITILLHWLMALMIIGMLCVGLYMTGLATSPQKFKLYGLHKAFGITILMLVMCRVLWRLSNKVPPMPANSPLWEKHAARAGHLALYGFMFVMPLTGWLMSSAAGFKVSFFGLFLLPNLIPADPVWQHWLKETHEYLAYGLIGLIGVHALAALKHHFVDKDDVLKRML